MATIGIAIESGSMQTILVEPASGEVLADRTTPLDPDAATVLTEAIEIMRAEAATLDADVDAVGVVYRTEAERAEFAAALGDESAVLSSASESFLGWLATSKEFADAKTVLLYYMGEAGVSISLADAADASITPAKTAALDSMSPERIGSTIPLAWEVVDQSGKKPEFVALFGDSSSSRDLVDILSLGLGVAVVRVGAADQVAARGAALLAHRDEPAVVAAAPAASAIADSTPVEAADAEVVAADEADAEIADAEIADAEPEAEETVEVTKAADLDTAVTPLPVPAVLSVAGAKPARSAGSGRKLVLAAVLLAGVLSAGVAVAATLPGESETTAEQSVDRRDAGADLAGATRQADPTTSDPVAVVVPPVPAVVPPLETIPPTVDASTVAEPAPTTQAWATQDPPRPAAEAPQPVPAPTRVDPPQFTVPVPVPEPGKSPEQLEQEAWDRHWQQTGQWFEQEFSGR